MLNQIELTKEQILDLAKAAGNKLGFLITASSLASDQKETIINILQYATSEQLDKFTEILEESYLEAHGRQFEGDFRKELEKIKAEFDGKEKELEQETLKKLKAIEMEMAKKQL